MVFVPLVLTILYTFNLLAVVLAVVVFVPINVRYLVARANASILNGQHLVFKQWLGYNHARQLVKTVPAHLWLRAGSPFALPVAPVWLCFFWVLYLVVSSF